MLRDLVDRLMEYGRKQTQTVHIHDDGDTKDVLFVLPDAETGKPTQTTVTYEKPPPGRDHVFGSTEGFIEFLNSKHAKDHGGGVVFLGEIIGRDEDGEEEISHEVRADMAYGSHLIQQASLPLIVSAEYQALILLAEGVGQKRLWRLLVTDLKGCMDSRLAPMISAIKIKKSGDSHREIDVSGITSDTGVTELLSIVYGGEDGGTNSAQIPVEWAWQGRIFDCIDRLFDIELRLEVDTSNGLTFTFHPAMIEKILRGARLGFVDALREKVGDHFDIYEGSFGSDKGSDLR